jgi:hypothetical protein
MPTAERSLKRAFRFVQLVQEGLRAAPRIAAPFSCVLFQWLARDFDVVRDLE